MGRKNIVIAGRVLAAAGAAGAYLARRRGWRQNPVAEVRAGLDETEGLDIAFGDEMASGEPVASIRHRNRIKTS